jgi:hypothetical protein
LTLNADQGKSTFLYYLLLRLLSQKKPVALQMRHHFLLFNDNDVEMHPLDDASLDVFPPGTWTLSDSNEETEQPCFTFLNAARQKITWNVQTATPSSEMWNVSKKQHNTVMFVMKHFTLEEITALRFI